MGSEMQPSISPVSPEVGKGTSRFPALSQPGLGNGDAGSAGAEDVAQVPSRAARPRSDNKAAGCWITVPSQEIKRSVCWMRSRVHLGVPESVVSRAGWERGC